MKQFVIHQSIRLESVSSLMSINVTKYNHLQEDSLSIDSFQFILDEILAEFIDMTTDIRFNYSILK
jgi:hypothetical protein